MESVKEELVTHCYCSNNSSKTCMLPCTVCKVMFHLSCLKSRRPSDLAADIYFKFTCANCSPDGVEIFDRMKLQWTTVLALSLYNLQLQGGGKCGYFHWREHICRFIDQNWLTFFGTDKRKSHTWHGTVAGCLSASGIFLSGSEVLGESGWWTLKYQTLPTISEIEAAALPKPNRKRKTNAVASIIEGSRKRNSNVIEAALSLKEKKTNIVEEVRSKIKQKNKPPKAGGFSPNHKLKLIIPKVEIPQSSSSSSESPRGVPKLIIKTEKNISPVLPNESANQWFKYPEDMDLGIQDLPSLFDLPPPLDSSNTFNSLLEDVYSEISSEKFSIPSPMRNEVEEEVSNSEKSAIDLKKAQHMDISRKKKAVTKDESAIKEINVLESKYTLISVHEEEQLLAKLEAYPKAMETRPDVRRLYRKLVVRRLKRERNIPLFNIDAEIRAVQGIDPPEYCNRIDASKGDNAASNISTILDRYQINYHGTRNKSQQYSSFITRLMGIEDERQESITSPYTERILKPFIFRDYSTKPLKLQLLEEIVQYANKSNPDFVPPKQSPIDYCYVRPQHILPINALCHEYFWPGIDLSETLQYPDFSCVALYRKIIVGFAFMVPDVKYNEAYITFVFCHPEWRRAGIATFMLYHLIQTCMGKDITLHTPATSSAVFLYQKFGFKIEEFIHDYYDKYLPAESKECRHAVFLRLRRQTLHQCHV